MKKHVFKVLLLIISVLLLFQFGSYYIYGKNRINVCYYEHISPLVMNVSKLAIYSEKKLSESEKEDIKEILKNKYEVIGFPKDSFEYDQLVYMKNVFTSKISTEFELPFQVVVHEFSRTKEYVEVWESELYWFLGKWYLRKKLNVGQS